MLVKELIEILREINPDAEIFVEMEGQYRDLVDVENLGDKQIYLKDRKD